MRDPVRDKLAFSFEDLGEISAKNIARPIHVFRVRHDAGAVRLGLPTRMVRRLVVAAVAVLVVLGAGDGVWFWVARTAGDALPRLSMVVLPFENFGDAADNLSGRRHYRRSDRRSFAHLPVPSSLPGFVAFCHAPLHIDPPQRTQSTALANSTSMASPWSSRSVPPIVGGDAPGPRHPPMRLQAWSVPTSSAPIRRL